MEQIEVLSWDRSGQVISEQMVPAEDYETIRDIFRMVEHLSPKGLTMGTVAEWTAYVKIVGV
jgi:hypothetical protein